MIIISNEIILYKWLLLLLLLLFSVNDLKIIMLYENFIRS
jgi:hypothetical protein